MRRAVALLAVLVGLVALPACTGAQAGAQTGAQPPPSSPGAPGIGDPYFPLDGNGGYDVARYDLDVGYTPATDALVGTASITARATQGLSAFNLDLVGLEVRSITVDGADATWTRDAGELTVTPAQPVAEGAEFVTVVTYDGVPQTIDDQFGISGFIHTPDGALVVGQPDVAATWFPANDHPLDPAAFTFRIAVPDGVSAIANGVLDGPASNGDGTSTWTWTAEEPLAPYLAGMAIGAFDVRSSETDGIRYWDALDPTLGPAGQVAAASLARQPEVIAFLAERFGPYPFSAAGGIVDAVPELGFALENQTRPIYSPAFFDTAESGDSVVVHELAHQWFGDAVPLTRWQDIWLNEGFATYAEWMWSEQEGLGTAAERFAAVAATPAADPFWTVPPGDPGPDAIFDAAVYDRGAMAVHALRTEIGDDAFFRVLQAWTARGEGGTTDDFVALAEQTSGTQLDALFTTWLVTPEKPAGLPG